MAATSWQHIRPLDGDLEGALEQLRTDVFATGAFYMAEQPSLVGAVASRPSTVEEVLDRNGLDGTHSVLDICHGVTMQPTPGAVSPLDPRVVEQHFASRQPSLFQVLMSDFDAADVCEPGAGRYFLVLTPDEPTLVVFVGCTGT